MQIEVSRSDLARAVAVSAEFASKSKNFPLLNGVSLTAADGYLTLIATDIEAASRYRIAAEGAIEPGSVNLPMQGLRDFAGTASGGAVKIDWSSGKRIRLECGRATASFRAATGEAFPATPVSNGLAGDGTMIPALRLAALFARTSFVNQRSDGMPIGEGFANPNTSAGVRLIMNGNITTIAHDGHRMARCVAEIESGQRLEVTVPPRAAKWLSTARWERDGDVLLQAQAGGVILSAEPLAVFFRTTNIHIPDTKRAFSPDFDHRATFGTQEFIQTLSAVAQFSDSDAKGGRAVIVSIAQGTARVVAGGDFSDVEATGEIGCQTAAPPMEFEFDPRYLIEFARAVPSETFDMRFTSPADRCRFTHGGDTEFAYVVGPRYRGRDK